jgi:hypothetical protein
MHRGVGTQRDQDRQPADATVQGLVDGAEQQRQWAAPGAVGHQHAHAAAVKVDAGQLFGDESAHLVIGQNGARTTHNGRLGALGSRGCLSHVVSLPSVVRRGNTVGTTGGNPSPPHPSRLHDGVSVRGTAASPASTGANVCGSCQPTSDRIDLLCSYAEIMSIRL